MISTTAIAIAADMSKLQALLENEDGSGLSAEMIADTMEGSSYSSATNSTRYSSMFATLKVWRKPATKKPNAWPPVKIHSKVRSPT